MLKISLLTPALLSATLILTGCGGGSGGDSHSTAPDVSDQVIFSATGDINTGNELWISDGTESGTKQVKDINASGDSDPHSFTKVGSKWFFVADNGINGNELWITDGTDVGTSMVEDIKSGLSSSYPENLIAYNGKLIFSAQDNTGDTELWISDGTEAGTRLVKNILPGNRGSKIRNTVLFNGQVYFTANDENYLRPELWKTDGTEAGTGLAARINQNIVHIIGGYVGSTPMLLTPFGDELIMTADSNKSDSKDIELELFVYSKNGSVQKHNIHPGEDSSLPSAYTEVNGQLFFVANAGNGYNILVYSNQTTRKVTNFTSSVDRDAPKFLTAVGNKLFFVATDPSHGAELWVINSNGAMPSAQLIKDINPGTSGSAIRDLNSTGSKLVFVARDDLTDEDALWVSDGTEAGTTEVSKISETGSNPRLEQFMSFNDTVLFSGNDDVYGNELWVTDGTTENTVLLKDINLDSPSSHPAFVDIIRQ